MKGVERLICSSVPTNTELNKAQMENYIDELKKEITPPSAEQLGKELVKFATACGIKYTHEQMALMAEFLQPELSEANIKQTFRDVMRDHDYKIMPNPAVFVTAAKRLRRSTTDKLNQAYSFQSKMPQDRPPLSKEHRHMMADRMKRISQGLRHGHTDGTPYGKDYEKDRAWAYDGIKA